jgi:hypothetical protein
MAALDSFLGRHPERPKGRPVSLRSGARYSLGSRAPERLAGSPSRLLWPAGHSAQGHPPIADAKRNWLSALLFWR